MYPVVAPAGTSALILVEWSEMTVATVPLKVTVFAFRRWAPLIVTSVPGFPEVGLKLLIFGGLAVEAEADA
jgi:hypothetical protein